MSMIKLSFKTLLAVLILMQGSVQAQPAMWEAGRLDYINGHAEVAAFVNAAGNTQLQVVLCSKNEPQNYRVTLLLPKVFDVSQIFEVKIECDSLKTDAFAELNGNSLEFQLDSNVYTSLPDTPNFTITFNKEDAQYLEIPEVIDIPMVGAAQVLSRVASECTVLCLNDDFSCRKALVSSVLWPRGGFSDESKAAATHLCTKMTEDGLAFELTNACKVTLNRFYEREGKGPLSFLEALFADESGSFSRYVELWNHTVGMMANGPVGIKAYADDREWYLLLYTLAGGEKVIDLPLSYQHILQHGEDPTTLIYDIENRYEMENLKYTSVLMRRNQSSISIMNAIDNALKVWQEFYRDFTYALPVSRQAQALRPLIYREMLMRVWRMAGMPQGLNYHPEFAFVQGTGGKTVTHEALEKQCAYFEGVRRDEFFFATPDCIRGIETGIRHQGFKNEYYDEVIKAWDTFAKAWKESQFYQESVDDAVGEHLHSSLGLTLLSMFRIYGFGDYFLLRSCISTRDNDICSFEAQRSYNQLTHEFHNKLASIMAVSRSDGKKLQELQDLWQNYQDTLEFYLNHEVMRGALPLWRAELVKGVSAIVQTDAIINAPYREEMPDVTLDGSEDDFESMDNYEVNSEIVDAHNMGGIKEHQP